MKPRAKIVGDNVNRLRRSHGLTQEELARGLDVHPSYIGLIERGERVPSLKTLESMADYFGVSAADLMVEGENREGLSLKRRQLISFIQKADKDEIEKLYQLLRVIFPKKRTDQKIISRRKR